MRDARSRRGGSSEKRRYPDYKLYVKDNDGTQKTVAIIEAKNLITRVPYLQTTAREQLEDYIRDHFEQATNEPNEVASRDGEPVVCGIVTNGRWWYTRDFRLGVAESWCEFELADSFDPLAFLKMLGRKELPNRLGL
ncbi:MAG TPA: hypothetical protein VFC10_19015 [Terriglobia bacterium]|nr:hypothetical protein [Terriglobia bacterium]